MSRLEYKSLLTAVQSIDQTPKSVLIGAKGEIIEWDTRTAKQSKTFKSHIGQVTTEPSTLSFDNFNSKRIRSHSKVQDLAFLNENEFVSAGDNVSKESAQFSLVVWDLKTTAILSNQIFHVISAPSTLTLDPVFSIEGSYFLRRKSSSAPA